MRKASELMTEENGQINDRIDAQRIMLGNPIPQRTKPCPNNPAEIWVLYYGSYILAENDLDVPKGVANEQSKSK